MYGYKNCILEIDLSSKTTKKYEIGENILRKYLGGLGLAAYLITERVDPQSSPYDACNPIVIATGPLTGTCVTAGSRMLIAGKSPATNGFFYSLSGGRIGVELKQCGYDAVILTGKADERVWLDIEDSEIRFMSADKLWGMDAMKTQTALLSDKKGASTLAIGQGGENNVLYSAILTGTRCLGRGGLAAVLGNKNVKAIRALGNGTIDVPDAKILSGWTMEVNKALKEHPALGGTMPTYGTPATLLGVNTLGALGTRNMQIDWFENGEKISGPKLREEHYVRNTACYACPISCSRVSIATRKEIAGIEAEGPDFETLYSFGSMLGIDDLSTIIVADTLCDEYGLDTISTGVTIGFAMECAEKGYIPADYPEDGVRLVFGDYDSTLKLIPLIAERKGIGDLLANGCDAMAAKIGNGSEKFAPTARGVEFAGHSPRGIFMMGLGYATSPRGGSHLDSRPTMEYKGLVASYDTTDKGKIVAMTQEMTAVGDCMILCRFTEHLFGHTLRFNPESGKEDWYTKCVNLVTGWDMTLDELEQVGERVRCLVRMFNLESGFKNKKDTLPYRVLHEKSSVGPSQGKGMTAEDLDVMLKEYYKYVGWDENGVPTPETIARLGLTPLKTINRS